MEEIYYFLFFSIRDLEQHILLFDIEAALTTISEKTRKTEQRSIQRRKSFNLYKDFYFTPIHYDPTKPVTTKMCLMINTFIEINDVRGRT